MKSATVAPAGSDRRVAPARVENLSFAYPGGRVALRDVSLELGAGRLMVLRGDSGSGKTSLLRALCGLIPHFHGGRMDGAVFLDGRDTRTSRPEVLGRIAGMLFQDPERQSVHRSVLRDVAFGLANAGVAPQQIRPAVATALEEVGSAHLIGRRLDELSGGERQRVALAGVIACGQSVVLLDEPASQLDAAGRAALERVLGRIRSDGRSIVLSDHVGWAGRGIDDAVITLRAGSPDRVEEEPEAVAPDFPTPGGELLVARQLTVARAGRTILSGRDLTLARGEVRALTGANGTGKTTLLLALAGAIDAEAGEVRLAGRAVSDGPLAARFPATALVPQDPRLFFLTERVADEIAFALRAQSAAAQRRAVAEELAAFDLEGLGDHHPLDLSSGQRQRVALAAAWAQGPELLLLDEPTRGLDARRRRLLVAALARHARRGGAALVATHDPELAAALPGSPVDLGHAG
mgnify:CR=1 FL=1